MSIQDEVDFITSYKYDKESSFVSALGRSRIEQELATLEHHYTLGDCECHGDINTFRHFSCYARTIGLTKQIWQKAAKDIRQTYAMESRSMDIEHTVWKMNDMSSDTLEFLFKEFSPYKHNVHSLIELLRTESMVAPGLVISTLKVFDLPFSYMRALAQDHIQTMSKIRNGNRYQSENLRLWRCEEKEELSAAWRNCFLTKFSREALCHLVCEAGDFAMTGGLNTLGHVMERKFGPVYGIGLVKAMCYKYSGDQDPKSFANSEVVAHLVQYIAQVDAVGYALYLCLYLF